MFILFVQTKVATVLFGIKCHIDCDHTTGGKQQIKIGFHKLLRFDNLFTYLVVTVLY